MKLNDKKTLREKTVIDLRKEVNAMKKEYAVAKMQFKVGKLPNPKLLSKLRNKMAVSLTVIQEKETV